MYIKVKLLSGFEKKFFYSVPQDLHDSVEVGSLVSVPVKKSIQLAVVDEIIHEDRAFDFPVRPIIKIETFPRDSVYVEFIQKNCAVLLS